MYQALSQLTDIIRRTTFASDFSHQIRLIVAGISEALGVDACTIYRQDLKQNLDLVASHGLVTSHPVRIPRGQGLVGRVVQSGQILNIINPEQEPGYYYVQNSHEEQFHSFCGVPLIHHARVVGVLVIQRKQPELINLDDEAVLLTLASHLALLLKNLPELVADHEQTLYKGVSGALGVGIGRASLRQSAQWQTVQPQSSIDIAAEKSAWQALQADVLAELRSEQQQVEQVMGAGFAAVLDAYQQFLQDQSFVAYMEQCIDQGSALPWAIKQTVNYFIEQFLAIEDPYLQARHEDISHLGEKLYQVWCSRAGADTQAADVKIADSKGEVILYGDLISVSDIISLPTQQLKGIVCSGGAALSHIAVFANALGIPAVMGVGDLPVHAGDMLIVDGDNAEVHIKPAEPIIHEYRHFLEERDRFNQGIRQHGREPAVTLDGHAVTVMANSGLQADVLPGLNNGADGIGLYRTELPFMIHPNLPSEDEQCQIYRRVLEVYGDKPVCFRVLDIGGDKPLPYLPVNKEENPALGLRGIRFLLENELLFTSQLRAILRAAIGFANVRILLPMLMSTQELNQCHILLDRAVQQLSSEGLAVKRPFLGIMVEVPGAVSLLPFWKNKLDFLSIGSNDLSQYLLAVDRNNPLVAAHYNTLHPAVIHEIYRIVTTAASCGLPVSLCGEMAADPIALLLLLGMGIRWFSMSAARIPVIKWLIQHLRIADLEKLLAQALTLDDAAAIHALGAKALAELPIDTSLFLGIEGKGK